MMFAAALFTAVLLNPSAPQEPQALVPAAREVLSPAGDLDTLTLVMSGTNRAVVRFGPSAGGSGLITLQAGDRIGRTAAVVYEIAPGRVVLDETTRDPDGRPRRTRIVFREGRLGGQRYTRDPGMNAPSAVRPEVLGPDGKVRTAKKPGRRT